MSDSQVSFYIGCIFCGIKQSCAVSDSCLKDKVAEYLIQNDPTKESRKHIWTEVKQVSNWYGKGLVE